MNSEVRLLFLELADLGPAERERVFRERQINAELRAEVESLLGYDSTNQEHLPDLVSSAATELLPSKTDRLGAYCGQFRIVRMLGSGGMGEVYLAERTDGEIQQQVAIKLLGFGERSHWRDRFLKERRMLATLNHPSIVKVIDAGHTEDGQPYLAMEYVEGSPIDAYSARIGERERLQLFLHVCEGVSHAHNRLIIHRDLKPSNILVDSAGQPKLLDFGIAKLLDATEEATQTVDRLLTPNYASPEQWKGLVQTTATDVYSSGAVLYKMLTGCAPQEGRRDQARSEIVPPSRLNPRAPRDLDFILSKALREEPGERYASMDAFAADIRAVLESRPVAARSGNIWYRTRKFVRRYRAVVAAAATVVASLSAGLYVANRERLVAENRFQQLRQLSNRVFELDRAIRGLPGSTEARERLVSTSLEYLEGLRGGAQGDMDLAGEIADGYERVARIQGVPTELNLGHFDKAEETLKKADALAEAALAARPEDRKSLYRSARIAHDRMVLAASEQRNADALVHAQKVDGRLEAYLHHGEATESERDEIAMMYSNVSLAYRSAHRYGDSAQYARKSVAVARTLSPGNRRLSSGLSMLSSALRDEGDLEGALRAIQEAREIAEKSGMSETARMIALHGALIRQGLLLGEDGGISLGRPLEAIEPLQKALDLTEEAAQKSPNDFTSRGRLGATAGALGAILRHRDPRRALAVCDLGIRRLGEVAKNLTARRDRAELLAVSSYPLLSLGRPEEARQRIEEALSIFQATHEYPAERISPDSGLVTALSALADYQASRGDSRRAIAIYEELLDQVMASKPDPRGDLRDANKLSNLYRPLTSLYRVAGDPTKADAMEARSVELWQHWDGKLPNRAFIRNQLASLKH